MKNYFLFEFFIIFSLVSAQVQFDSDFESGNLKSVTTYDSSTYYVSTYEDIGGRWFYFRISGVKDKEIRVEVITNPADFTRAMYSYDNMVYLRFSENESPQRGIFQKTFENDTVYVAYYTPYTFKMLQEKLSSWELNRFVTLDTIGYTQNFLPIQEMIVTDPEFPDSEKLNVWVHSRTHPSETPSSWHFEGIVKELLSDHEVINYYLSRIKFFLIPFTNPDGVYLGRSRTNYDYVDVERDWDKMDAETCLEVLHLKNRMEEICEDKPFSVFLNLHSQAVSYCTFWIHTAGSTSDYFYRREYQFSNLNISDNPYFVRNDYSESSLKSYFPEGWLWENYGDKVMALTYETPYDNYFRSESEPYIEVTNENLFELGRRTVYAIAEYLEISHPYRYIMDNPGSFVNGEYTNYSAGLEFYGEDFTVLPASSGDSYITFVSEDLPAGMYDVSAWWPTSSGNSYETVFQMTAGSNYYEDTKTQKINGGQWNYLTTIELSEVGSVSIKMESNATGLVVADAFRLVYSGPVTSVEENNLLSAFKLYQNYPNPFNPITIIRYSIPNEFGKQSSLSSVELRVFDILGKEIEVLVDQDQYPGEYEVKFDGSGLASGTYIYSLQIDSKVISKKMILIK